MELDILFHGLNNCGVVGWGGYLCSGCLVVPYDIYIYTFDIGNKYETAFWFFFDLID